MREQKEKKHLPSVELLEQLVKQSDFPAELLEQLMQKAAQLEEVYSNLCKLEQAARPQNLKVLRKFVVTMDERLIGHLFPLCD